MLLLTLSVACDPDTAGKLDTADTVETSDTVDSNGSVDSDTAPVETIEVGPYTPAPIRILPLGDSITEYCYRYDLWTKLVDAGYAFDFVGSMHEDPFQDGVEHTWPSHAGLTLDNDHDGHAGWTSGQILTTPLSWDVERGTLYDWLDGYTPDVVLIHLGTNDAFYEYNARTLTANLEAIIAVLREANPHLHVHLAQIIPLVYAYWGGGTYDFLIQDYNEAIAQLVSRLSTAESPVLLVDQYTGFDGEADTYDLIHPNASGDEKVASRWMESIAADAAPIALDDDYATSDDVLTVPNTEGILANDRSLRGSVRAVVVDPPSHGHLRLQSDGAFSYTGDGIPDQFSYIADDGTSESTPATVTLCAGAGCFADAPAGLYVDCDGGDDAADGRGPETAWASLDRLAAEPLLPGDAVWFVAGTTCRGTLRLSGSGTEGAPITVGAWGDGAAPVIEADGEAAVSLGDQSWITLDGLEVTGSTRYGVYVHADTLVQGITLRNLEVHGVHGGAPDAKGTGLVVFTIDSAAGWFEDVLVEGVEAWDTDQWAGVYLYGTAWREGGPRSARITFRGNVVHDVGGDGIVVFGAEDALLEANLTYEVGLTSDDAVGTPNAIWTWDCRQCTVQFNEAHHTHSPGVDGGAFDIDWDNVDNVVQYNYGHDNDGYCVAVFGAEGSTTTGSVVRYNVCRDNSQAEDLAYEGDIFLYTWDGGALGDVQIYNNTVLRAAGYPPLIVWSAPGAGSGIWNNIFVVDHDWLATVAGPVAMSNNVWWQPVGGQDAWFDDNAGGWYNGLDAWQAAGRESDSVFVDPLLVGGAGKEAAQVTAGSPAIDAALPVGAECDGFGGAVVGAPDIGAHELGAAVDAACGP